MLRIDAARDHGYPAAMATKRSESNALQIRVTDAELGQLDEWVTALQRNRPGSSGVSRTTVLRDLLIAELDRRKVAVDWAKRANKLVAPLGDFKMASKETKELRAVVEEAMPIVRWLATARLQASTLATRILIDAESTHPAPLHLVLRAMEISRTFIMFMHETDVLYGAPEPSDDDVPF